MIMKYLIFMILAIFVEIEDEEEYTDEQLKEIKSTIYGDDDTYSESNMEMNDWNSEDTIYSIKAAID